MRIAYLSVRYGEGVHGGAESACRSLAEHLAALGVDVEVHTTCATDTTTWADHLPPGTTVEGGVTVHRHRVASGRHPRFEAHSGPVLAARVGQRDPAGRRWIEEQGPVCPAAVDAALASAADLVVATPYLYWPTVEVVRRAGARVVLHPAAHDEAAIRLPLFAATFAGAGGLAFYTDAERRLVERLFPAVSASPQLVCGLGVDPPAPPLLDPEAFRAAHHLGDDPYLLYLGRVDEGKGTAVLNRFFAAYKLRRPGPLRLVYAGPVIQAPTPGGDVRVVGPVSDTLKWSALAGATALAMPSVNESFSIVVLEAWLAGRPVLVNARGAAISEHTRRAGGGLAFAGYASFEAALDRLVGDPALAGALGRAGRAYTEASFAWEVVTRRYRDWLERVAGRTAGPGRRPPIH